jgi:hypothetical protein
MKLHTLNALKLSGFGLELGEIVLFIIVTTITAAEQELQQQQRVLQQQDQGVLPRIDHVYLESTY